MSETVNNAEEFEEELHDTFYDKKVLIEGDSWVSHPQVSNLAKQFEQDRDHEALILNLGAPGDDAYSSKKRNSVFRGPQFRTLTSLLTNEQHGYEFDLVFLSVAGNDIIGPEILDNEYVEKKVPGKYGGELLTEEYDNAVEKVVDGYELFIEMARSTSMNKTTPIVTHSYAFLQPQVKGSHLFGFQFGNGWIATYLEDDDINVTDPEEQYDVVKTMFSKYLDAMGRLDDKDDFYIIDTTETLLTNNEPDTSYFHDEIHPKGRGFRKVYAKIKNQLKSNDVFYS